MSTVKSFVRKNSDNLFVKIDSRFDGMTDCVESVKDTFRKVSSEKALGIEGVYTVGSSRDYITKFENDNYIGFEIYNSCGCGVIATLK